MVTVGVGFTSSGETVAVDRVSERGEEGFDGGGVVGGCCLGGNEGEGVTGCGCGGGVDSTLGVGGVSLATEFTRVSGRFEEVIASLPILFVAEGRLGLTSPLAIELLIALRSVSGGGSSIAVSGGTTRKSMGVTSVS